MAEAIHTLQTIPIQDVRQMQWHPWTSMLLLGPTRSRASQVSLVLMVCLDSTRMSVMPVEGMTMVPGVIIIRPGRIMTGGKVGQ